MIHTNHSLDLAGRSVSSASLPLIDVQGMKQPTALPPRTLRKICQGPGDKLFVKAAVFVPRLFESLFDIFFLSERCFSFLVELSHYPYEASGVKNEMSFFKRNQRTYSVPLRQ
jgi:hypothetical protein